MAINHGGARPGAGRPKASRSLPEESPVAEASAPAPGPAPAPTSASFEPQSDLTRRKAEYEAIKIKNAELEYARKLGTVVDREAVRTACAAVFAQFSQGMRSMQDRLERELALAPEVVEAIGNYVDTQLDQLATGLDQFRAGGDPQLG